MLPSSSFSRSGIVAGCCSVSGHCCFDADATASGRRTGTFGSPTVFCLTGISLRRSIFAESSRNAGLMASVPPDLSSLNLPDLWSLNLPDCYSSSSPCF